MCSCQLGALLRGRREVAGALRTGACSRQRDHSAAPASPFSRRFNSDGEGVSVEMAVSATAAGAAGVQDQGGQGGREGPQGGDTGVFTASSDADALWLSRCRWLRVCVSACVCLCCVWVAGPRQLRRRVRRPRVQRQRPAPAAVDEAVILLAPPLHPR